MALQSGISTGGHGPVIVYYRGPRIIVTNRYIETATARYAVRDLEVVQQIHVVTHSARTTALFCGAVELVIAAPLAVAFGSAIMLVAGLLTAIGVASAQLIDERRNPRWMAMRAVHRGTAVTIFSSRNQREFEQVRRAVIRAVAANELLRP